MLDSFPFILPKPHTPAFKIFIISLDISWSLLFNSSLWPQVFKTQAQACFIVDHPCLHSPDLTLNQFFSLLIRPPQHPQPVPDHLSAHNCPVSFTNLSPALKELETSSSLPPLLPCHGNGAVACAGLSTTSASPAGVSLTVIFSAVVFNHSPTTRNVASREVWGVASANDAGGRLYSVRMSLII